MQRWLKFVKYLPEYGVNPVVFVPENPNYPIVDKSLEDDVPKNVEVIKLPIKEPYQFARLFSKQNANTISKGIIRESERQSVLEKLMLYVRGNFFIPDARVGWVKPAVKFLLGYLSDNKIETVITTGPPHSIHLIGMQLKQELGLNWIADFRDPWTTIGYHKQLKLSKSSQLKHKNLEKQVLNSADQVIVTSDVTKQEFSKVTNKPIDVITNGYDDETSKKIALDKKFTVSHVGSFLSKRNPRILWKVLSELIEESSDFKKDFQLNLVGYVSDEVYASILDFGLSEYINNTGYVSHEQSIDFQKKSQLLLLVEIDSEETKCIIPGKLFEYMVSNRPILAIGPDGSDVEQIIKSTNTGFYYNYNDSELLKKAILECYNLYKDGNLKTYPIGLQKYHRKSLTKSLSQLL